jgi:hypothetical protein
MFTGSHKCRIVVFGNGDMANGLSRSVAEDDGEQFTGEYARSRDRV